MVDICACSNEDCTKRTSCYRYLIDGMELGQNNNHFDDRDCDHYMEVKGED